MVFFRTLVVIMANPIRKITLKFSQTKYICTEMWHQKCPSIQCCTTQARGLQYSMAGKGPSPAFLPPPPLPTKFDSKPQHTMLHWNQKCPSIQCCTAQARGLQDSIVGKGPYPTLLTVPQLQHPQQIWQHASRNKSMWLNVDRSVEGKVHGFSWSARLVRQFLLRGCPIDYEPIANSTSLKRGE